MSSEAAPTVNASPVPAASPKAKKAGKVKAPKSPKVKSSKPKTPSNHPTYGDMVRRAITELKDKKGSSRAAILKYILQHFKVGENVPSVNNHLRQALKRGVTSGALKQVKGVGASGSFRIGEKSVSKKPAAAKPKSPKKATTKKPKAEGTKTKKPAKAKAAKKAKSPKKTKAAGSPKKAKVVKPKTAKKPAAKKSAPKKKATAGKKASKTTPTAPIVTA